MATFPFILDLLECLLHFFLIVHLVHDGVVSCEATRILATEKVSPCRFQLLMNLSRIITARRLRQADSNTLVEPKRRCCKEMELIGFARNLPQGWLDGFLEQASR